MLGTLWQPEMAIPTGTLTKMDGMLVKLWEWLPWTVSLLVMLPVPVVFLLLWLNSTVPETAAFYFILIVASTVLGGAAALFTLLLLLILRRRWLRSLRDRLAQDGVTVVELPLFSSELTSYERQALAKIRKQDLLLADAYSEILASRLTATRIISRVRNEQLELERRITRARSIAGADTASLLRDLQSDRAQLERLRSEAASSLAEANARLQMIEAAAGRSLGQKQTDSMLRRLTESQNQLPLRIQALRLEQEAENEARETLNAAISKLNSNP
jgi:hypothetical protein